MVDDPADTPGGEAKSDDVPTRVEGTRADTDPQARRSKAAIKRPPAEDQPRAKRASSAADALAAARLAVTVEPAAAARVANPALEIPEENVLSPAKLDGAAVDVRDIPTEASGSKLAKADAVTARPGSHVGEHIPSRAGRASFANMAGDVQIPAGGYDLGLLIGKGGMGEVIAATDLKFGRDIAIKRMLGTESTRALTRFLREARIQARLEHPGIVPVHDLGTDAAGRPFFAMKRLAGVTLAEKIVDGEPFQPLLRAFVEVLLAIEFAHARGVVHRDLKPANIMLGEFGEVYVLDWGVARELGARDDIVTDQGGMLPIELGDSPLATKAGSVLGTPGYMSPEQVRGDPAGTAADIYALGAILFEILTAQPLHPHGDDALVSTLTASPESPVERRPDRGIAPELDNLCLEAQAEEPDDRPTARDFAERLRRYIDGDRDLELRRTLAAEQLAFARAALAKGESGHPAALRHAGRALALDPSTAEAADLIGSLLLERPKVFPPELVASLDELDRDALKKRSRRAALSYGAVFVFLGLLPFVEVRSWPWVIAFFGVLGAQVAFAWRGALTGRVSPFLSMLGNFTLALVWTRFASSFILTPAMICGASIAVASHPWNQGRPWTIFAWSTATVTTPLVLEAIGVLEPTWKIADGAVQISSSMFELRGTLEAGTLTIANLMFILLVGAFAYTITRTARIASREHHIQAWRLRHLIPERPPPP